MLILISGDATSLSYGRGGNSQVIEERGKYSGTGEYCVLLCIAKLLVILQRNCASKPPQGEGFANFQGNGSRMQWHSAYARLRNVRFVCYILRV